MLKVRIETKNAAFEARQGYESARILREIANKLDSGINEGVCHDHNGGRVGEWKLSKR